MFRAAIGLGLLVCASSAAAESTDFGVRTVGGPRGAPMVAVHPKAEARSSASVVMPASPGASWAALPRGNGSLSAAARLGGQWGRVTSTYRSPAHNRRVGGVANSWHLHGRAIDIARRSGVTHAMVAAAFRNAGYRLIESLDEGDHIHFAFAFGGPVRPVVASAPAQKEVTSWGVVSAAAAIMH